MTTGAGRQPVKLIFAALMLVLLLASLDQTIVSTALPTIPATCTTSGICPGWSRPICSPRPRSPAVREVGDLYGRKIVLQTAIVIFLGGSALCGTSGDMAQLIAYRGLQGWAPAA